MTVQVDFWHLVGLLLGFFGACAAAGRLLLSQSQKHLDERFATLDERFAAQEKSRAEGQAQLAGRLDAIEQVNRDETLQWQRVEREMLKFQADLPMRYVMRDDYIRGQTILEAKMDAALAKIDAVQLRAAVTGGNQ